MVTISLDMEDTSNLIVSMDNHLLHVDPKIILQRLLPPTTIITIKTHENMEWKLIPQCQVQSAVYHCTT
jgi:hypothetical protein